MTKEKEHKLTIKQEAFARAYVETGNASEAYRRYWFFADGCAAHRHAQSVEKAKQSQCVIYSTRR